jgi:hypothetical protein
MIFRHTIPATVSAVLLFGVLSGCNRDQDQTTPVGQKPQSQTTAQDFPSTRNMEQPDPSVGGNNSAATQQAPPSEDQRPPAGSPSRQ